MNNPYIDKGGVRIFLYDVDEKELVWHRDREDRKITVIESSGWKFQFDDCLPFEMNNGDEFTIPKMKYHRIIKDKICTGNLVLKITRGRIDGSV